MPVIVNANEKHPFLPSLADPAAIERERAAHQDIRPLEIAILNLMADKVTTERQLAQWLGHTPIQVRLSFVATDRYFQDIKNGRESKNTPPEHIRQFYKPWSEIKKQKFDGLIVTGVNAREPRVTDEVFWPDVQEILDWSHKNVFSSLFLCWGAKAALKHFHNIDSIKGTQKTTGLFEHRLVDDKTGLLSDLPDRFPMPVSRWKNPDAAAVAACPELEIAALSDETGPNVIVEAAPYDKTRFYPKHVYILGHPEYETETLGKEYWRDYEDDPASATLPLHYFPDNDPSQERTINNWRHTAYLYTNWVNAIYAATPRNRAHIPRPYTP
ncbi:MAG: homoserine O-succinyltransferase [Alphaproteobacteria bacterium]|nr:homoserine O-succinyltransferase [Alphaproteobacteria bacterium]